MTTSTSGVATVELKQAAGINLGFWFGPEGQVAGPAVSTGIEGDGRMIAMVLERGGHAVFDYYSLRDCTTAGCEGDFQRRFSRTVPRHLTLNPAVLHVDRQWRRQGNGDVRLVPKVVNEQSTDARRSASTFSPAYIM